MHMVREFEVKAPPAAVFAFFADLNRIFVHLGPTYRMAADGPLRAGAAVRLHAPKERDDFDGIVEVHDPPVCLVIRIWPRLHPERVGVGGYELEATHTGTRVRSFADTQMSPLLELAGTLLRPLLELQARRGIKKLLPIIESEYREGRL